MASPLSFHGFYSWLDGYGLSSPVHIHEEVYCDLFVVYLELVQLCLGFASLFSAVEGDEPEPFVLALNLQLPFAHHISF